MRRVNLKKFIIVIVSFFIVSFANASPSVNLDFKQLLNEAGLILNHKPELMVVKPQINSIQQYEYALRTKDDALEIRYAIRPLSRVKIDYEDPHSSAPDPNHLFPLLFDSMLENLSKSGQTPKREYSQKQARDLFNADWANAAAFDLAPEFSKNYKQGLLIAIHKNMKADVYAIYLYNDYLKVKKIINESLDALIFK